MAEDFPLNEALNRAALLSGSRAVEARRQREGCEDQREGDCDFAKRRRKQLKTFHLTSIRFPVEEAKLLLFLARYLRQVFVVISLTFNRHQF